MRRSLLLILAVAVAVVVALLVRDRRHSDRASALPRSAVSMIGDSLNLGTEVPLRDALPAWTFRTDDVVGRDTAAGIERLRAARLSLAPYIVVSLGTNDPPSSVDAFRRDVAEALRVAGSRRCVIWSTIYRDGTAYDAFTEALRSAASRNRNLRLVEWSAMIGKHREWLASDGVHGNPAGYAARADAVVTAMRSCHAAGIGQ